jgi:hypothetical protein
VEELQKLLWHSVVLQQQHLIWRAAAATLTESHSLQLLGACCRSSAQSLVLLTLTQTGCPWQLAALQCNLKTL